MDQTVVITKPLPFKQQLLNTATLKKTVEVDLQDYDDTIRPCTAKTLNSSIVMKR